MNRQSRLCRQRIRLWVAPVRLADGAYIAAGSTITNQRSTRQPGHTRGRQVTKARLGREKRRELAAAELPKRAKKKKSAEKKSPAKTKRRSPSTGTVSHSRFAIEFRKTNRKRLKSFPLACCGREKRAGVLK